MINSIELQVICKILTSDDEFEVERLCSYDSSYYAVFNNEIEYILEHKDTYGQVPDLFTFQAKFEQFVMVQTNEPVEYLENEIKRNKQLILLRETFNKLADLGSGDVEDAWEYLNRQCDKASELDTSRPMDIVKDAAVRADEIVEFNKQRRIPTGFKEIDNVMYGGLSTVEEFLVIVARTNSGKAQPLWSKVLTPQGWTTMGDLKLGDIVVGANNDNGKVIKIFPQGEKDYYRITFDDNSTVECCDDHLWTVYEGVQSSNSTVLMTKTLRENLGKTCYSIQISEPLEFEHSIHRSIEDRRNYVAKTIKEFGTLHGDDSYVFVELDSVENAEKFVDEARSIGFKVIYSKESTLALIDVNSRYKVITNIEYVGKTECQCILLDNETHTYITDGYTTTHNSWVCTKLMESAQHNGFPVLYYSPEMQSSFIGTRFDTWRGHFKNSELFRGRYDDDYKEYLKNLVKEETGALVVEDSDMSEGKTTVHNLEVLVKKHHIKLLIIDGLSYISQSGHYSNESLRYKEICNSLFKLSKTYGCAVVAAIQANRESRENRDENGEVFPSIYNISESDHPARIATQVFALRQLYEQHIIELRLEKSRNAKNEKPVLAYVVDFNTGHLEYVQSTTASGSTPSADSDFRTPIVSTQVTTQLDSEDLVVDDFEDEDFDDIEF